MPDDIYTIEEQNGGRGEDTIEVQNGGIRAFISPS